jgi:hypothetical protein
MKPSRLRAASLAEPDEVGLGIKSRTGGGSVAAKKITQLSADGRKPKVADTPVERLRRVVKAVARPRTGPVALLEQQNTTREPDLVPIRHGRT